MSSDFFCCILLHRYCLKNTELSILNDGHAWLYMMKLSPKLDMAKVGCSLNVPFVWPTQPVEAYLAWAFVLEGVAVLWRMAGGVMCYLEARE